MDNYWQHYLSEIGDIRESIHLKRVGGQDPYVEFQKLAIELFDKLLLKLDDQLIKTFESIEINNKSINLDELGMRGPSATWTYLINDNPFEHIIGMQLIGDPGKQLGAVIMTPLLALQLFFRKKRQL